MPVIPVTVGNIKEEDSGSGQPGKKVRSYVQNNQRKRGWRCGSIGSTPT
jgi:hypothetical protein